MSRAIFLDRDGVINENRQDHVKNWTEFEFLPSTLEALRVLSKSNFLIFVITNQAVINRGLVPRATVDEVNWRMVNAIQTYGGRIDKVLYCPHRPEEDCECRKPRPGLLLSAAKEYQVDLRNSYVVGDALTDIQAGQAAGCQTILVLTGRGRDQLIKANQLGENGFAIASDLLSAVRILLQPVVST